MSVSNAKHERRPGGCLCGAVRFVAMGRPIKVNLCHCQMCRKASGAPVVAWAAYERDRVQFEAAPTWRQSSAKAERGFCPSCGSALAWHELGDDKFLDLAVGAFDEPDDLKPAEQLWMDARIRWLKIEDSTPKYHEGRDSGQVEG